MEKVLKTPSKKSNQSLSKVPSTDLMYESSLEKIQNNNQTPIKLPAIQSLSSLQTIQTTPFNNNSTSNNGKSQKPPVFQPKKGNAAKLMKHKQEVEAKNNPIFCRWNSIDPETETHNDNHNNSSLSYHSQSGVSNGKDLKIASTPSHNDSDDDEYDSPEQRENMHWQENSQLTNERSYERFRHNYQRIQKIEEVEKISPSQKKNPIIEYLKQVNKQKSLPHMLAFKKNMKGDGEFGYNLKSFYINSSLAKAFSENLKANNKLSSLILERNKLNDQSFSSLATNFPVNLQRLDISNNPTLSIKSYVWIKDILSDQKKQKITYINFEGNLMGDDACREVCDGVVKSGSIKVLNLSKNNITDQGAPFIAETLNNSVSVMTSLLLHWNQIRGKGSAILAKALKKNETIQIFDASFNSFGSSTLKQKPKQKFQIDKKKAQYMTKEQLNKSIEKHNKLVFFETFSISAYRWNKALSINKKLVHVDLSFNNFKTADVQAIGEGLKMNHSILGIHMMGNEAKVDELGFVTPMKEGHDNAIQQVFTRIPKLHIASNCWICEGWTQMEFRIQSPKLPNLHLSFEQFKPCKMNEDQKKKGTFYIYRMIPPGNFSYFFTHENDGTTFTDPNTQTIINQEQLIKTPHITINVPKINYIENIELLQKTLTSEDLATMKAIPRPEQEIEQQKVRPKSPWTFPKSLFAQYKQDNEDHLADCFEFDWKCSKIEKIIKREAYKYCASLGPSGNVFSIGTNVFSDIIYNCTGLLDSKFVKLSDVDLEFISTKAGNQYKSRNNPDRQIIRFQFMEIFVRLGIDKYFKSKFFLQIFLGKICETYEEAVTKVFEENILPYFKRFNSNDFRWQKLYNEPCDLILKKHLPTLKEIFKKYSGRETLPGEIKFMSMNEFIDLVVNSGVLDDNFGAREIGTIYNLSMMTQIDEIYKDKHYQMSFIEFIEALSRVADRVMIRQPYQDDDVSSAIQVIEEKSSKGRESQLNLPILSIAEQYNTGGTQDGGSQLYQYGDYPLEQKINDYIQKMALNCMGEEFAYQFKKKHEIVEKKFVRKNTRKERSFVGQNDRSVYEDMSARNRYTSMDSDNTTPIQSRIGRSSSMLKSYK